MLAPAVALDWYMEGAAPGTQHLARFPVLPAKDTFGLVSLDASRREGRSAHWTPNAWHGFQTFRPRTPRPVSLDASTVAMPKDTLDPNAPCAGGHILLVPREELRAQIHAPRAVLAHLTAPR